MPRRDSRRDPTTLTAIGWQRRRLCRWLALPASALAVPAAFADFARVASARVWPAQEYTRVIVESTTPLAHQLVVLRNPDRLALDISGVDASSELAQLPSRLHPSDPYIAAIRLGRQAASVMRIVLDLKSEVRPDIFQLAPIAEFGYRLVLDLYPLVPLDPLMALLASEEQRQKERGAFTPNPPDTAIAKAPDVPPPKGAEPARPAEPPARERVPTARAEPKLPTPRRITIAIDPGHGGEDPGAIGRRGTFEKNVVLAIARKLKARVDAEPGMRAMLTRDDDYFVPLAQRVQKARRVQADLFISIHADAFREPTARGSSVFALSESGATSAAAKWLAQKENQADLIGGVDLDRRDPVLARTLLDLSQTAQIADSLKVGRQVLDGIGTHNALHKSTVEQAGFAVLKAPDIPSILVETAFISNPDEELKLRSDQHQKRFADSIHEGVLRYFAQNPRLARA
jgi:N-acetylmuramoyl-L-alanine amidase